MKIIALTILALISLLCAQHPSRAADPDFLNFIKGSYTLIGKQGDTDKTYSGTIDIDIDGQTINILRTVNGKQTKGTAQIEKAEGVRILIVTYDGQDPDVITGRYNMFTDPDNYSVMTGFVMKNPQQYPTWLEALFYKNQPFE